MVPTNQVKQKRSFCSIRFAKIPADLKKGLTAISRCFSGDVVFTRRVDFGSGSSLSHWPYVSSASPKLDTWSQALSIPWKCHASCSSMLCFWVSINYQYPIRRSRGWTPANTSPQRKKLSQWVKRLEMHSHAKRMNLPRWRNRFLICVACFFAQPNHSHSLGNRLNISKY